MIPVDKDSIEEDQDKPKVALQFTNSRTNAKKTELQCTPSEDTADCKLTHAAQGWDVKVVEFDHIEADAKGLGGKLRVKGAD